MEGRIVKGEKQDGGDRGGKVCGWWGRQREKMRICTRALKREGRKRGKGKGKEGAGD